MRTADELFADTHELNSFSDVMLELGHKDLTPTQLRKIFDQMPDTVRNEAHCWGLSDSVFGDLAYIWLSGNTWSIT